MLVLAHRYIYQVGAHFEALKEGVLMAPLDSRYIQVGFNVFSVQVCWERKNFGSSKIVHFVYFRP